MRGRFHPKGFIMKHRHLFGASFLAISLSAPAAFALTPDEVWASWQAMSATSGATITAASTVTNGPTLEVSGISVAYKAPGDEGSYTATVDKMTFTDKGDGTVEVKASDAVPVMVSFVPEPGMAPVEIGLTISQPGMSIIASGTAEETAYDYAAPTFTFEVTSLKIPDEPTPSDFKAGGSGTNLAGHYVVATADGKTTMQSSATMAGLSYEISGSDPEGSGNVAIKGSIADLKADSSYVMLGAAQMQDISAALKAGFMVKSALSTGKIDFDLSGTDPQGPAKITGSFAGSSFGLQLDKDRVDYGFGLTGAAIDAAVPDLPLPVKATWGETSMRLALPIAQTAEPQDYVATLKLIDVNVDESIWSMFDPGAQLNHDPVTLILDLAGGMAWTVDILAPGALESSNMPAQLFSLDLTQVLAKAAGTEVGATGGLTFDNSDLFTFGGIPAPSGKITVTMKGINALIDALVGMGLVPEDEVMGARMMLAMFARPGAGPDELISEIEFKDKTLLVNGQPMPM